MLLEEAKDPVEAFIFLNSLSTPANKEQPN